MAHIGSASRLVPTVKPDALPVLQILSPMVVRSPESPGEKHLLLAGRRTYQLHTEQLTGSTKVSVLAVTGSELQCTDEDLALFDELLLRTLWIPDERARSLIAAGIQEKAVNSALSRLVGIGSQEEICRLLGVSRATLHRKTIEGQEGLAAIRRPPAKGATPLSVLKEAEERGGE